MSSKRLGSAGAHLLGWALVASVNLLATLWLLLAAGRSIGLTLVVGLYGTGQLLFLGLVSYAAVLIVHRRLRTGRRWRLGALLLVALAVSTQCLGPDFRNFVTRQHQAESHEGFASRNDRGLRPTGRSIGKTQSHGPEPASGRRIPWRTATLLRGSHAQARRLEASVAALLTG